MLIWSWPSFSLGASFGKDACFNAEKYQFAISRKKSLVTVSTSKAAEHANVNRSGQALLR